MENGQNMGPQATEVASQMRLGILVVLVPVVFFLTGVPASAQRSNVRSENHPATTLALEKLEVVLCDLLVRGEWQKYADNLADDYVRVLPGTMQNKQEVLQEFRDSKINTIAMIPEKMQTRIYGDSAVMIIDLLTRNRAPDGTVTESRGRATKVFVRRNGRWYLAQLTASPLTIGR